MIPNVLLGLFGCTCLWFVIDGLRRRGGVFEVSFLAGCGLFGFLFTQAVGVVSIPGMAPESGIIKGLVMSTLCAWAIYFGWKAPLGVKPAARPQTELAPKWVYRCGVACIVLGLYGMVKLLGLTGGLVGVTVAQGRHALVYKGLPVMYAFFEWYGYIGLVLVVTTSLRLRSWLLALPAAVPVIVSLYSILIAGRRTEMVIFFEILGCCLYFCRNIAPPRLLAVGLVLMAATAMFFAPEYRHNTLNGRWSEVKKLSVSESVQRAFTGMEGEFWTQAYEMEITDSHHYFQFGIGFYNSFVQYFVPKMIVGEDFKQKLYVPVSSARYSDNRLGWLYPSGMVPTGPFSVFEQFWYFGAAVYYFLARWMKRHWVQALKGDFLSTVVYSVTITFVVTAVVNDIYSIYMPLFMYIVPLAVLSKIGGSMRGLAVPFRALPLAPPPVLPTKSRSV